MGVIKEQRLCSPLAAKCARVAGKGGGGLQMQGLICPRNPLRHNSLQWSLSGGKNGSHKHKMQLSAQMARTRLIKCAMGSEEMRVSLFDFLSSLADSEDLFGVVSLNSRNVKPLQEGQLAGASQNIIMRLNNIMKDCRQSLLRFTVTPCPQGTDGVCHSYVLRMLTKKDQSFVSWMDLRII